MSRHARLLLPLLLTYQFVVQAADAPSISPQEEAPTNCVDGSCSKRTLFNIIWGCLSTTIICAWATLHPNIPPQEGLFKGKLRKLELMLWTIVAPEILPAWALNQRLAAKAIRDMYNESKFKGHGRLEEKCGIWKALKRWFSFYEIKKAASFAWTMRHGHFLVMGGFHLVEPPDVASVQSPVEGTKTDAEKGRAPSGNGTEEGRVTILTLEMLRELLARDPEFKIEITEKEIADRSKGDTLSNVILIFQSSWFIIQSIARHVQGLPLTQLELTTLALASLHAITFLLWWQKPLGVEAPVRVYMKRKLTDVERQVEGEPPRGQSTRSKSLTVVVEILKSLPPIGNPWWILLLPLAILLLLLSPVIVFALAFFATISDVTGDSTSFPVDATHVPTFYVPDHPHKKWFQRHTFLLIALGTTFGSIHCAGWNFPFPTYPEQKLWRVASLAVTIIPTAAVPSVFISAILIILVLVLITLILVLITPILVILILIVLAVIAIVNRIIRFLGFNFQLPIFQFPMSGPPNLNKFFEHINREEIKKVLSFVLFWIYSVLAYTSARLVLLGLALALLRHQPPSAFIAVDWTKFYPHTF